MSTTEIANYKQLKTGNKYFSRTKNKSFTFIKLDADTLFLGVDGKLEKVTIPSFSKLWMKDGVVTD